MLNEAKNLYNEGNYDELMRWAFTYDSSSSSKEQLKSVAEAYELLIDKGYGVAANNLGSMYYCGRYFETNVAKAIGYYETAMEMGEVLAWSNLGCCYYYDLKDYRKAYDVFSEGAFLFNDPECLYMLGDMYRYGKYVKASENKTFHLYRRATDSVDMNDNRHRVCLGSAYCRLGDFLIASNREKDIEEGIKALYVGLGHLYEGINENQFIRKDIEKYRTLLRETEMLAESEYKG